MENTLQQVALAVPPIDHTFDPEIAPLSGEEYLQHVIYERNFKVGVKLGMDRCLN